MNPRFPGSVINKDSEDKVKKMRMRTEEEIKEKIEVIEKYGENGLYQQGWKNALKWVIRHPDMARN